MGGRPLPPAAVLPLSLPPPALLLLPVRWYSPGDCCGGGCACCCRLSKAMCSLPWRLGSVAPPPSFSLASAASGPWRLGRVPVALMARLAAAGLSEAGLAAGPGASR